MGWGWVEAACRESLGLGFFCDKFQGLFSPTGPPELRLGQKSDRIYKPRGPPRRGLGRLGLCRGGEGAQATDTEGKTELPRLHR